MSLEEVGGLVGFDTVRVWSTQVQVFNNPNHTLFVFREHINLLPPAEAEGAPAQTAMARNVASVVMPVEVAKALSKALREVFPDE